MADILAQFLSQNAVNPNADPFGQGVRTGALLKQMRGEDEARARQDYISKLIGGRVAEGDYAGARDAAYREGALDLGSKIEQHMAQASEADRKRFMEAVPLAAGFAEKGLRGPQLAQALTQFNFSPQEALALAQIPPDELIAARDYLKGPSAPEAIQEVYDPNSPTGTRFVRRSEAIGQPGKPPSGQRVNVTPEGGVTIESGRGVTGVSGGPGLNKQGVNTVQKKQINAVEALDRLGQIQGSFKPEFLEIPTKIGVAWSGLRNRLGVKIGTQDRKQLKDFSKFKRDTLENINRTLNELSGAAVSPQEATRIRGSMPDVGDSIFSGDSPVSFKAKLDDAVGDMKRAVARYSYLQSRGFGGEPWKAVTLDQMDEIIDKRGAELEAQAREQFPNFTDAQIAGYVRGKLGEEFGIGAQ